MSEKRPVLLSERLNKTGQKITDLSSKLSAVTKSAVNKTNDVVKSAVTNSKAKIESKRAQKIKKTKDELSAQGILDDVPPMVTLPEFEHERMAIVSEQNDNQIIMFEHMERLSARVDILERRHKARIEELFAVSESEKQFGDEEDLEKSQIIGASASIVEALHVLGVSIVWIAILIGIDKYGEGNDIIFLGVYPISVFSWSLGAFTWALYLLHRLLKSGIRVPLLIRLQTSIAVGLITLMGVMLNEDAMGTVSNVWTWGTLVTIGLLIGSSMIATAWRSARNLVTTQN